MSSFRWKGGDKDRGTCVKRGVKIEHGSLVTIKSPSLLSLSLSLSNGDFACLSLSLILWERFSQVEQQVE